MQKKGKNAGNARKICALAAFMCVIIVCVFLNDTAPSKAAWVVGETDSDRYEVVQLQNRNDATQAKAPLFSISTYKSSTSKDKAYIGEDQAVIQGVGHYQKGDSFTIQAKGQSANFKGQNLKFESTNKDVLRVSSNGSCTIVGPGTASVRWTYTYQRFYDEETTTQVSSTDESGNETTQVTTTTKRYVDSASTISGDLTLSIYPQILKNSTYMMPNDTMYLQTNVPATDTSFSADCTRGESLIKSLNTTVINGFWYIVVSSYDDDKKLGSVYVRASIQSDNAVLYSDNAEVIITNNFSITPTYSSFNCVSYKKNATNGTYREVEGTQEVKVETTSNNTIDWVMINDAGEEFPITSTGDNTFEKQPGLTAKINGQKLVMTTNAAFFDKVESGVSQITFKICATQKFDNGTTYNAESYVNVTRPVKNIEIHDAQSDNVLNSRQEMYTKIGYKTNGNGLDVPSNRFGNDTDILTAWLAGLGDDEIQVKGTNGETVTSYRFEHTPYNSEIKWVSSDENVIQIQTSAASSGYSTCNVVAVGAGEATVTAVSADGGFVASVEYIVRPYPQKVTMKDPVITERLGDLNSKKVTLIAYVTSGDEAADKFLDDKLLWEISSVTGTDDAGIASVDDKGIVTFSGPGTVVVKATSAVSHNGFNGYRPYAVCTITIEQPVEKISIINKPDEPIMTGDSLALKTKIEPSNATDQSVTWSSANPSIVSVDQNGKVTAHRPGSTTVRVQTHSGAKYDTCTIDVKRLPTGVTLNKTEAKVSRGKKLTLLATVHPDDATDKSITWSSSNKNIATVSDKGVVTGVQVSKDPVIITATTSNGKSAECYVTVTEPVTGLKISPTKKTIYVGKTFTIKKRLYPLANASINQKVYWSTTNKNVAVVDENGKVTPKAGGKCKIVCKSEDGGYVAECSVTVKEKVQSITLNRSKLSLSIGKRFQLRAAVRRSTATNRAVSWSSNHSDIVSVDKNGRITTKKTGTAVITCKAKDGSGVKAKCKITVVRKVGTLRLNKYYITLITGYRYRTLKATLTPKSATNKKLYWSSSNSRIVSVNKRTGTLFAEHSGTAYVKVRTTDGSRLSKTCRVKVIDPVPIETLTISQSTITLAKGQKSQLEARAIPTNTTSAIRWMTDDRSVATVSQSGMVTAMGPGTTTITAYCKDGVESQCTVQVVQMNPTSITIEQYDKYTLSVDGASSSDTVIWNSSNADIVSVSNGTIMGVKPGTAIITASCNGKKVRCRVTVKRIS